LSALSLPYIPQWPGVHILQHFTLILNQIDRNYQNVFIFR